MVSSTSETASVAPSSPVGSGLPTNCPNCRASLEPLVTGTAQTEKAWKHCPRCGALLSPGPIRFRHLVASTFEHVMELEVPLLRTFIDLFRFPGRVAREYVDGRRKFYTNPLKYNLITAVALVAVVQLMLKYGLGEEVAAAVAEARASEDLIRRGLAVSQDLHNHYLQFIYVVTLPVLALMMRWLITPRRGPTVMEYYVLGLYAFGQIYLMQGAAISVRLMMPWTLPTVILDIISSLVPYIYLPIVTVQFTGRSFWRVGLLGILVFFLYTVFIGVFLLAVGITWLLMTE